MAVITPVAIWLVQSIINPSTIWILIPLAALCIPIIAIFTGPIMLRMKQAERREARKLYERIVMEKLDVMKTAVAMGFEKRDLQDLDARLERLVGSDKLQSLLDGKDAPAAPAIKPDNELFDADLTSEIDHIKRRREKE